MNKKQQLEFENEQEAAEDAAFMDELTQYVATLPEPSPADLKRYQEKMDYLAGIHAELEAKRGPVKETGDDWEPDSKFDDKYLHQYQLGKF